MVNTNKVNSESAVTNAWFFVKFFAFRADFVYFKNTIKYNRKSPVNRFLSPKQSVYRSYKR